MLHGQTGYEEVEVNNRGRVIRQLKVPPQAGRDIYLTLDLKLQQYIETLLAGSRAAVVVTDRAAARFWRWFQPRATIPTCLSMVSPVKIIPDYSTIQIPAGQPRDAGVYPPASTVKPYVAVSALSAGVITRNTSLFDPGWWQLLARKTLSRLEKWGHGHLNVTKALEESADTYFYQVAYDMGIDRLSEWMSKFGYGDYTGVDGGRTLRQHANSRMEA